MHLFLVCMLPRQRHYFEVEILGTFRRGAVGIGLVCRGYPKRQMPGWKRESVGYHSDDGKLFVGRGQGVNFGPQCEVGDRMGCGLRFNCQKWEQRTTTTPLHDANAIAARSDALPFNTGLCSDHSDGRLNRSFHWCAALLMWCWCCADELPDSFFKRDCEEGSAHEACSTDSSDSRWSGDNDDSTSSSGSEEDCNKGPNRKALKNDNVSDIGSLCRAAGNPYKALCCISLRSSRYVASGWRTKTMQLFLEILAATLPSGIQRQWVLEV